MTFNPHDNKTADNQIIVLGDLYFDNNLDVVKVVGDNDDQSYKCCSTRDNTLDGQHHDSSQLVSCGYIFSDHDKAQIVSEQGCYCRHDHWFEVEVQKESGTTKTMRSMNGERLSKRYRGKTADQEWAEAYN